MVASILKVGDKIDIKVLQQVENQEKSGVRPRVLKSIIYDIKANGDLEIGMPTEGGKMVLLALGLRYELSFYTKNGVFRSVGQVKERYKNDNLYMVNMELKTNLSKVQRREYYRYECLIDINYLCISQEEVNMIKPEDMLRHHMDEYPQDVFQKGIAVDISGGGIRFISEEALTPDDAILISAHLISENFDKKMLIPGIILQSKRIESDIIKYEQRIMFKLKDNRVREQIIKYIFEEERKSRKNEKG